MVRIKISLGVIIAIIVMSVSSIFILNYKTDRVLELLNETRSYSDKGDSKKALEAAESLEKEWEKYHTYASVFVRNEWQTNDSGVVKIDMTKPNQITLNDVKVEQNGNEELYKRLTEQCMNEKEANLFYWWVAESWGNNLPEGTDLTKYIKVRSVHITSPIN